MPRLRVLAGPSTDSMTPIEPNGNVAFPIKSDLFDGQIVVHIKNFPDPDGNVLDSEYFGRSDRQNVTWSIQVQGRFLKSYSSDDILFGNTFDRPLKLPWGAGAALKFMKFVDPTLEHDLTSRERPWALSPLIATMPHFAHTPIPSSPSKARQSPAPSASSDTTSESSNSDTSSLESDSLEDESDFPADDPNGNAARRPSTPPAFPSSTSLRDDVSHLRPAKTASGTKGSASHKEIARLSTANKRRAYFSMPEKRKSVIFGPSDVITTDFCYGFIQFPSLSLCLPGGISFDLTKYWDGQPVRFVCCERPAPGESPVDANCFWCVAIEKVSDE